MKLKLNKKKIKTLSSDSNSIPAAMTPQVAGGQGQDIDSSYVSYRCPGTGGPVSMDVGPTCGPGYTCMDVY